ncbi:MAG: response regulator [Desulfobacterales bacterium]|nr:response regulator [Desulfobacterales bacterium]
MVPNTTHPRIHWLFPAFVICLISVSGIGLFAIDSVPDQNLRYSLYAAMSLISCAGLVLGGFWIRACASLVPENRHRKAAGTAGAAEGEKYRALFSNMTVGVFYQQADGRLSDVNRAALDMFGLTEDAFLGKTSKDPCWRVVREDGSDFPGEAHPSMEALATGKTVKDVVAGIWNPVEKDIKWVSITAVPQFRAGETSPWQVFVTMLDITPRKRFEAALKQSEEKVQNLHDQTEQLSLAAAEMISIEDKERIFQKISDAIVAHSDYQRVIISLFKDEFPYRDIVGFAGISKERVDRLRNVEFKKDWYDRVFEQGIRIGQFSYYIPHTLKHILHQKATCFGEGPVPDRDNVWHPEDNLFVRMNDEQGRFIGVIAVDDSKSGDIPGARTIRPLEIFSSLISQIILFKREQERREKVETQLHQAMKMESIGTLAGGVAHDFNNILGVILGNTELSLAEMPEDDPNRAGLEEIMNASLRAADIVRQLLSFSRKNEQVFEPIDIVPVIHDTLNFMRSSIPATVSMCSRIQVQDAVVLADPIQINRILMNLCINAFQAMPDEKGDIEVAVDRVDLSGPETVPLTGLAPGAHLRILVSDTGAGISSDIRDRIFDPYFTTKAVGKGSGMGLAVVVGIVKTHNGCIRVDSTPGQGSCFTVYLPLAESAPVPRPVLADAGPKPGNETILFVDDDKALTDMYEKLLKKLGYQVRISNDPVQALDIFRTAPDRFDLLITDMTMPGMTGADLSSAVLDIRKNFPIIMCTGHSDLMDEESARKMGISAYVTKPVRQRDMSDTIRKLLDRNKN